ncbi:MAG: hypothetical protein V4537_11610 [Pseudomonadota bacterium]
MAHFYFHSISDAVAIDEEGMDLPDLAAAIERARREVRVLAAEEVLTRGRLMLHHRIEIAGEHGKVVAVVRVGDAVEACTDDANNNQI